MSDLSETHQEMALPIIFIKLSSVSLHNSKYIFQEPIEVVKSNTYTKFPRNNSSLNLKYEPYSSSLRHLNYVKDGTTIIGVDVSSIKIGETEIGEIFAIRGAIVWSLNKQYKYLRLGPFPFHVTEENKQDFFSKLGYHRKQHINISGYNNSQSLLCNWMERWIQSRISYSARNNIILWDGSLTTTRTENNFNEVSNILKEARNNSNCVLAFSKATTVKYLGYKITDLALNKKVPCLFEVENLPLSIFKSAHLLGKIFVTKFSTNGWSFRLDIDRSLTNEESIMAVERLIGNDLIFQGYPETLRLAHIYSTFTSNEVLGIQRFLVQEYKLKLVKNEDIRRSLFGPFGTGFEYRK
jgi:hypothetical protein